MKIVMVCDFYDASLEYQENLLVKYYRKHGHEVAVVTSTFESVFDYYHDRHDSSAPARTSFDRGAKILRLPYRFNILNRLRAFPRIDAILAAEMPQLIYVHGIMPNLPECIAYVKRHTQCRMIMDSHADYSNSGKNALSLKLLHGVARKWYLDRARPHLSRLFAISPGSATFLHEIYAVPLDEMELLPLGADLDLGREVASRGEGTAARNALGIEPDEIVIFTGGKLAPAKRTELLLEAVAMLPARRLRVVVAGSAAPEHAAYQRALLGIAQDRADVLFVGWLGREEIYRYLDMADIAVFPASQSILWQQAIAMGLPLIAGNSGNQDISYLNLHDNIIVLPANCITAAEIARAIDGVVGDPVRLRSMAEGARRVADEQLNWDRLIERTLLIDSRPGSKQELSLRS